MYRIEHNSDHLLVKFIDDFNFNMVEVIIHHLMTLRDYPDTNDIWLIGKHRADIRLGELDTLVREFQCRCPKDSTRSKTAIVVDEGLNASIIELWVKALQTRVSFKVRIFHTLEEAERWLSVADEQMV